MGDIGVFSGEIHLLYVIICFGVFIVGFFVIFIFLGLWQFKVGVFMARIWRRICEDLAKASTLWAITQHWC